MKMSDTSNLVFITNFGAEDLDRMLLAIEYSGINHKISEEATDIYDNPIPDCYALYLDETDREKYDLFWAFIEKLYELEKRYNKTISELIQSVKETGSF